MSTAKDILKFLRFPQEFADSVQDPEIWRAALDEFARPSIAAHHDRDLRPAQEDAWRRLADNRVGLVLGPPGTGKTHLLAWMITAYAACRRKAGLPARIFVTAFTRNAIGNVLKNVVKIRDVHDRHAPAPLFYGTPPDDGVAENVVAVPHDEDIRVIKAIGSNDTVIGGTIWSLYRLINRPGRLPRAMNPNGPTAELFDLICIDEASQMVLSHGLMALAGLAPACRVVVCGDDRQLPPMRMMKSTSVNQHEVGGSLYAFLKSAQTVECVLKETFRLNEPLTRFPQRNFYPGQYVSAVPSARLALRPDWTRGLDRIARLALDPDSPIVVIVHEGPPAAVSNPFEAMLTAGLATILAERIDTDSASPVTPGLFWSRLAAIISPHRAHNAAIRALLPPTWKQDAFVETVDRIQGSERDAILLSYCVSDPEFALAEADFIFSPERLNVAITRARTKLIMIVSSRLLETVPPDQETMEKVDRLRNFVMGCEPVDEIEAVGLSGRRIPLQVRACRFPDASPIKSEYGSMVKITPPQQELTAELASILRVIQRLAAAQEKYDNATLYRVGKELRMSREPFAQARMLHLMGWISLEQIIPLSETGTPFWVARPFTRARRVYDLDPAGVRSRIATIIQDERTGRHCFYERLRSRFAWMSEDGTDLLLPVIKQLEAEGLIRLHPLTRGFAVEMADDQTRADTTPGQRGEPDLQAGDFELLNRIEDLDAGRINFGVYDAWTPLATFADANGVVQESVTSALERLERNSHIVRTDEGHIRSRMGEIARELRHVKQRFRSNDAGSRPYLVRNVKVELQDRKRPLRDRPLLDVFAKQAGSVPEPQRLALDGLRAALVAMWGDHAMLARFQEEGLHALLAAWRHDGLPSHVIAADTGSGKTEAAVLPIIAAALADHLQGVRGTRAVLTYPRVRLATNQAQRLATYLAALARVPGMPVLTLGLQVGDVPDRFDAMHSRYHDAWQDESTPDGTFRFPFFGCPACGHALRLHAAAGHGGADALICPEGDWRFDGWIGSKQGLGLFPPTLFLPTTDSLHQWLHNPRYGAIFGDDPRFAPPRALLADEIHLYTHIHGAQVGMTLRRLAARAQSAAPDAAPMVMIGMSATISEPAQAWGRLIGRTEVNMIRPGLEGVQPNPRSREYFYFVQPEIESRNADIAGASTTIQSLMCLSHGMRRRSGKQGGYRSLVFFDSIDKMRRLHGAYIDAEEEKRLASLRISLFGDDDAGDPQTRCCRDPDACSRFADGECWWFAANDPDQCSVRGHTRPGTPLAVARSPIYSGVGSNAETLVKNADVVFATSVLEVGYDDPDITLVYQHYAPRNLASFVQRRGRGGRGMDDRSITAVTLSLYSPRDNWWFQRPREMISPTGFQIPLNPDNFFVRRGQALVTLFDGLARQIYHNGRGIHFVNVPPAMLHEAGRLVERVMGADVWQVFGATDAVTFWAMAIQAQEQQDHEPTRYLSQLRNNLPWAPNLLFDTINLPAMTVEGPEICNAGAEDIGLALLTIAPGNATRRYHPSLVHWRPPVQGPAPWLTAEDYAHAELQDLGGDTAGVLAQLPVDARAMLARVHPHLCRPTVATLQCVGRMRDAQWEGALEYEPAHIPSIHPVDDPTDAIRHDSRGSLRGFLMVRTDGADGQDIGGDTPLAGISRVTAFTGSPRHAPSGLHVARVFWGADTEIRFDRRGVDPVSISQTFVNPADGRPLLHGYQVETEGLRFSVDERQLHACTTAMLHLFETEAGERCWYQAQFLRYLVHSKGRILGFGVNHLRIGADLLATGVSIPAFRRRLQHLIRFWNPTALKTLFKDIRRDLLAQHPLLTPNRVEAAAESLSDGSFRTLLEESLCALRSPAEMAAYLRSTVLHGLLARFRLLAAQVGQGDERQLLGHARLPLQFGDEASCELMVSEAGSGGDGTVRGVIDNWGMVSELVASGYLATCPNADEDAMRQCFWSMRAHHERWRRHDPRDPDTFAAIARELTGEATAALLSPGVIRILFGEETIGNEHLAVYDIATEIERVRQQVEAEFGRAVFGWELASAVVMRAQTGDLPALQRMSGLFEADIVDPEEAMNPETRLAELVYRLGAPLCVDGCRGCVHQASDLMDDTMMEASMSRRMVQRFMATSVNTV
ncbi:AAA domain-containing protein [Komagataeibacter melomenusus]